MVIAATAAIILAVTGSSGAAGGASSGPRLAPLSTLGALQPAPAPGATGPEGVPVPAVALLGATRAQHPRRAGRGATVMGVVDEADHRGDRGGERQMADYPLHAGRSFRSGGAHRGRRLFVVTRSW